MAEILRPLSTDSSLPTLAAVRDGSEVAFRELFDALYGPLRGYARALVRDSATAEDLVQEAFVRLWDRRQSLEDDTSLRAYLYRTVRNLALNLRRDVATRQRLLDDPVVRDGAVVPVGTPAPDLLVEGDELGRRLSSYVDDLPPRQREAVELSRVRGLSHVEAAVAMGCSPRTLNNHLVAALATLRRRISEAGSLVAAAAWWLT